MPMKLVLRRTKVDTAAGKSSHRGAQKYERMPSNQGETAGEKGTFCRGKGEFDTGKLELRGRAQLKARPCTLLSTGARDIEHGRANPFCVFNYPMNVDSHSLCKVTK